MIENHRQYEVLVLYTDNIGKIFNKCKEIDVKILYNTESLDNYTCFIIEDLDENKIENSYYDK